MKIIHPTLQPILLLSFFSAGPNLMAQDNDTIKISKTELRQLIQEEVQKELKRLQLETSRDSLYLTQKSETPEKPKAEAPKLIGDRFKFSGTALLRVGEWDFDQNEINPSSGDVKSTHKRFWTRTNFYLNMDAHLIDGLDFHARIRTGQKQYSFVTFGENVDERFNIILDQIWLNYKLGKYEFRAGRQDAGRIWTNQKGAQFDIPMHDGITIVADYQLGKVNLSPRIAYFIENYQNNAPYRQQGKVFGASIRANQTTDQLSWKAETGLIKAEKLPTRYVNDLAQRGNEIKYHDGDLAPDYAIWTNQVSLTIPQWRNLNFTVDYYHNFKHYSQNPTSSLIYDGQGHNSFSHPNEFDVQSSPDFKNQNTGFIASISTGNLNVPKNIWASVSYLYMEKYAAMDYFAQYDNARWASTNIQGPEFSAGYRFNKYLQMRGRFFITKDIKGYYGTNTHYTRSADRFRLDFNVSF